MRFTVTVLSRLAAGLCLGLSLASASLAQSPADALSRSVAQIEERLDGRIGLSLVDTGRGRSWTYRTDERFAMNSTVKTAICGAVLARRDAGDLSLSDTLPVKPQDILSYAPVTERKVGARMSLAELCLAALDQSDNTATNMLIDHLGGPQAVTNFLRSTGDRVSRLDRREPELNDVPPGDPHDTTTPAAMSETLRNLLLDGALTPESRRQLADWMSLGGVTGNLLRPHAPEGWRIADKSGSGSQTRNIIAMITPEGEAPWIATIFISDVDADFDTRNAALQEVGGVVMSFIGDRQQ
ncbi:class A beta-lactamase [Paracoccus sp. Z330]|uniref:Beta-lactamase n=1 Tax=Paracoccus onchidii TaxID=3017813 RepID=A0ABT4ZJG1_9RHOB|nr:class A beta-lactamase [Paracoccus onchidii]MDB6179344.1 class A beta-lactamase [Paracoccus onchidii]